jgi:effector-binding domain-containing protein
MDIRLVQVCSYPLMVVRRRAELHELPQVIQTACGTLGSFIRMRDIKDFGKTVALYRDDGLNLEIGFEMETPVAGDDEVSVSATPAGVAATAVHFGPYAEIPKAHRTIRQWCTDQGIEIAGPNWDVYSPWVYNWCDDSSKIRTDVFYLLKESVFENWRIDAGDQASAHVSARARHFEDVKQ